MKKLLISIVVLFALLLVGLGGYLIGSPEIVVVNNSNQTLAQVNIQLPSNRIVFGEIQPKETSTIYYSWTQKDGIYQYQVTHSDGEIKHGKCGYVTNHQLGKRLLLRINRSLEVICEETYKM